jgi:hypothetical protein
MADSKISALPASTVPLAGTEVLPIVQSSTTKQVSVANLTAGRDIAATSLTTAAVQATNSGGLTLKNSSGTTQLSLGAGGGDNITLSVATNITPANAAVAISPTGTGTVAISPAGALTINPTAASTINNTSVGATTAATGRFTTVNATTSITNAGLTSGRITYAGASGLLTDSSALTWDGNLGINLASSAAGVLDVELAVGAEGVVYCIMRNNNGTKVNSLVVNSVSTESYNGAVAALWVGRAAANARSINAGGTVNASGADYAEYMTKAGDFTIAKGDVVGIDANGKLTNVFADSVTFVVKSTDPSYVGGDTWGNEESLGLAKLNDDATQEEKDTFNAALEAARQLVDRISFSGQVPVNVTGAIAGQYIIPVNNNGLIKGEAISNPTFDQYKIAIGKVIAIENDGRAKIIVKVI